MAAITFSEIMRYNPTNPIYFKKIKEKCGEMIPFVGAGLSVPYYPLWTGALKQLKDLVADPAKKRSIAAMLKGKEPKLLEAAQALEDHLGYGRMADYLLELFSATKIQEHKEELHHQSVWLLPLLFPGQPAVTTNFDRVLETVYELQGCQFERRILPNRQELQDQLRQGGSHGLLKLHGDIGSETLEYSSIIFGKRQYEEAYQPGTPIVTNLQAWFSGKILLFLGCSLKADEYLNLLQGVVQLHPGVTHYAILEGTNPRENDSRATQLRKDWGIRVLFYPKGRHEAVRVILEKLLEDHDPTAYQALPTHVGALPDQSPSSRFHYKSGAVSFHGRQEELEQLREFCGQEDVAFRWWAVTGAGGAGKSRLVYEFQQKIEGSGWNVLWLNSSHMDQLESLHFPTKTLVVVDYAQAYLGPLGRWMEQLAQRPRLVPVRLLLLERDGASLDESSWGSGLKAEVRRAKSVRESCWKEPFLQISPLQEEELLCIMTDYAARMEKHLEEKKAQQLLETLKTTDPELRRPLYAMFLTDAWANGEKPEQWGQKAVLDYVLQRENGYFQEKTKEAIGNIPRLKKNLNKLRLVATIWDGITLEQVAQEYSKLWEAYQQQADKLDCVESEEDLLRQVGILQGTELAGLKPDLLGEYFVLQHLNEPEVLRLLFPDGWQTKGKLVAFVFRMYRDYYDVLENVAAFWEYMLCIQKNPVRGYGMMLVNVTYDSNAYTSSAVETLKTLWKTGGRQAIDALLYAMGLVNLTNKQPMEGAEATIERLAELHEQYSGNKEIAVEYAKGLVNLTNKQPMEGAEATIEQLKGLHERYCGNEEIAFVYAKGLVNLSAEQPAEEAEVTVERLAELYEQYSGNQEIAVEYARGLVNLSTEQPAEEAEATIEQLKGLHERYCGNEEIALVYAKGLVNLSAEQSAEEAEATVEQLAELYEQYSGNQEIALEYARGIVNLSIEQPAEEAKATIEQLKGLHERYCGNEEMAFVYAMGLVNLTNKQPMEGVEATIERLAELHEQYSGNKEIALAYAKGQVNLSAEQPMEGAEATVERLAELYEQYSGNQEVALVYAKGLVNLSAEQPMEGTEATVERLAELYEQYSVNQEIALVYASGLVNLSDRQVVEEVLETIRHLEKLYCMYPDNEEMVVSYAMGLYNLAEKQPAQEAQSTIPKIQSLCQKYPENKESKEILKALVKLQNK